MADDLDAFFDDVSEAEQEAVKAEEETQTKPVADDLEEPPSKKAKTDPPAPPVRPKGVVVASATPVGVVAASAGATSSKAVAAPEQSYYAPSSAQPYSIGPAAPPGYGTGYHHGGMAGPPPPPPNNPPLPPPLPPGPPPPPPPPTMSKAPVRTAAGKVWVDQSLATWPDNDFRLFVGNISPEVSDEQLYQHFSEYPSLHRTRIVRDPKGASKGYGFVSLLAPLECAKALRAMDQSWLGDRPVKVKRSTWKDRDMKSVRKNEQKSNKQKKRKGLL